MLRRKVNFNELVFATLITLCGKANNNRIKKQKKNRKNIIIENGVVGNAYLTQIACIENESQAKTENTIANDKLFLVRLQLNYYYQTS